MSYHEHIPPSALFNISISPTFTKSLDITGEIVKLSALIDVSEYQWSDVGTGINNSRQMTHTRDNHFCCREVHKKA
ncbi:hypothetical protein ACFL1G_03840 [Planctomycetota bacterium]